MHKVRDRRSTFYAIPQHLPVVVDVDIAPMNLYNRIVKFAFVNKRNYLVTCTCIPTPSFPHLIVSRILIYASSNIRLDSRKNI